MNDPTTTANHIATPKVNNTINHPKFSNSTFLIINKVKGIEKEREIHLDALGGGGDGGGGEVRIERKEDEDRETKE